MHQLMMTSDRWVFFNGLHFVNISIVLAVCRSNITYVMLLLVYIKNAEYVCFKFDDFIGNIRAEKLIKSLSRNA